MSSSRPKSLLVDEIDLLVKHFGIKRVRDAVAKISRVSTDSDDESRRLAHKTERGVKKEIRVNGNSAIETIRFVNPEKYELLTEFYRRLQSRDVLPESQDIRHFAQIAGLKEINGKSREDLLPKLVGFLAGQSIEKLRIDITNANNISEQQRQMGYSVLADKLIGLP